jgi:hypothetical protein
MARVIQGGRITSVVVEHVGSQFTIWRLDQKGYVVFCNHRGGLSVTISGEDADELEVDLRLVKDWLLTKKELEDRLATKIYGFLGSIKQ